MPERIKGTKVGGETAVTPLVIQSLRRYRAERGITREGLASRAHVGEALVEALEEGHVVAVDRQALGRMGDVLGTDPGSALALAVSLDVQPLCVQQLPEMLDGELYELRPDVASRMNNLGWTHREIGRMLDVSTSRARNLVMGTQTWVGNLVLARMCTLLGCPVEGLVTGRPSRSAPAARPVPEGPVEETFEEKGFDAGLEEDIREGFLRRAVQRGGTLEDLREMMKGSRWEDILADITLRQLLEALDVAEMAGEILGE